MLARIRKSAQEREQGFTLIELLVVMIIIGILAAIAIPVFLSQRNKAQDTAAKNDVSILGKEIATYWVDGTAAPTITMTSATGNYVVGGNTLGKASANNQLAEYGATLAAAVQVTTLNASAMTSSAWCVAIRNSASGNVFKYSAANGLATGQCTAANGT